MCKILLITFILCFVCPLLSESLLTEKWNIIRQVLRTFLNPRQSIGKSDDPPLKESYDFIIVGSGSSGSVLANRLSEIASWNILLLEAGNPGNVLTQVPLLAPVFQLTPYSWNYTMQRQDGLCMGMEDQVCAAPRGKGLGGSSLINYMLYTRGNPIDYNRWAEKGNEGWSYEEVLPYFRKSEDCKLGELCANRYHSQGGYLSTEHPYNSALKDVFLQAGVELGEKIVDCNTPEFMGFSHLQANMNFGRRHSTAEAFLYPIINSRRNLKIITSARVTKVLIDPATRAAQGVLFKKRGRTFMVRASKEVILSAGALNSPQLLMLSGIGPKNHLEELGIPVLHNLPVGQQLYDHLCYIGLRFKMNQTVVRENIFDPQHIFRWLSTGRGLFTSIGGVDASGLINTGSIANRNYPDIEILFAGSSTLQEDFGFLVGKTLRLRQEVYDAVFRSLEKIPNWNMFPMLLHPRSRGHLKLRSQDPYEPPLIYGNYFTDPEGKDIRTMLASIRYIQKLSRTSAFQKFGSQIHDLPMPGCERLVFDSDDYWFCALRTLTMSVHHHTGTCKMGPIHDEEAVVDSRLRVHGMKHLRVIDAGIVPSTVSGHMNAPSIMIGEKGSDMIKEDWGMLRA